MIFNPKMKKKYKSLFLAFESRLPNAGRWVLGVKYVKIPKVGVIPETAVFRDPL